MLAMSRLTWILIFVAVSGINAEEVEKDVDINEHPYLVSIIKNGKPICSGAILNEYYIVTSDRCVPRFEHAWNIMNDMYVVSETSSLKSGGTKTPVKETFSQNHHINPINNNVTSGLGVLKLTKPLKFGENCQPIELYEKEVPVGAEMKMIGWNGHEGIEHLKEVTINAISSEDCQQLYEKKLSESELCSQTKPKSKFCEGDSGSPITCENKLVCLATYGIPCDSQTDICTVINKHSEYLNRIMQL